MTAQDFKAPESVSRLQQRALIVGIIGVVGCIIGYVKSPEDMLRSYLMAFMLILGLSLGSLGLLMLGPSKMPPLLRTTLTRSVDNCA